MFRQFNRFKNKEKHRFIYRVNSAHKFTEKIKYNLNEKRRFIVYALFFRWANS